MRLRNQPDEYSGENEAFQYINVIVTDAVEHLDMQCPVT